MARFSDDDFHALQEELDRSSDRALGSVRRASGALRNAETEAWLAAGDNLAEKAVAALDTGDDERAEGLVRRIIALPMIDDFTPAGLTAVSVLLYSELIDPSFDGGDARGLVELPLRLLPTLDEHAADAMRRALAAITDYDLPARTVQRIQAVVPLESKFDPPFAGVTDEELPTAVLATLRLILRIRAEE